MTRRVAGIGEVLWDRFPDGDRLGGAPANFAFHAGQLGAAAQIVSRIGRDADGDRLAGLLEKRGLPVESLQRDSAHPTGLVRVELRDGQPSYVIESPAAWDFLELTDDLKKLAASLDAVCFGTLAQRHSVSRRTIQDFIRLCPSESLRLFDLNFRQNFFTPETIEFGLWHATALKLNGEELVQLARLAGWPAETEAALGEIFRRYPVKLIALTHGADGCEIRTRGQKVRAQTPKITCVDAVGAGDAFAAALVTGLLADQPLEKIAEQANRVGAYVASQAGGMPELPPELKNHE
jgi:fructokinase